MELAIHSTQRYCCVMIPECVTVVGLPFRVLPPGVHWASLSEIESRFGQTAHRAKLIQGVLAVAEALRRAKCERMYLDGSFVTEKMEPNDFDGCWDPTNVIGALLDPVFLDFSNGRAAQKVKYGGEMFVSVALNAGTATFLDFFQREKVTGAVKGIVGIDLSQQIRTPQ
jgi:hypothetical protein